MSDLKISQLPAATPLTGAELIELVQSGANVQSTASALVVSLSPLANFATIAGNPNGAGPNTAAAGTFGNFLHFVTGRPGPPGSAQTLAPGMSTDGSTPNWQQSGGISGGVQGVNPSGTTLATSVARVRNNTSAAANSATDHFATIFNATVNTEFGLFRQVSSGLPIAGFTMTAYFVYATTQTGMTTFVGLTNLSSAIPGTQVPSALTNSIGLSKDSGDTNLQFLIVDGTTAAKTDTGISMASVAGHLLKLVITCDGPGNCAITLTDLETGGAGSATHSYPANTAHLPAQNVKIEPHLYAGTGSATSAITFDVANVFVTTGFIT